MHPCAPTARHFWLTPSVVSASALILALTFSSLVQAESPQQVVRVEEDWELVIQTPDADSSGPQVTSVISPTGDLESLHLTFEINHQSLPEFVPGGLQLQTWEGEYPLLATTFPNPNVMATPNEVVTWTQVMSLNDNQIQFSITHGLSTTWGKFGGQGYMRITKATSLADLNQYDPTVSVENSGIPYAANRVKRMTLKRVRKITADGEVLVDNTDRPVHVLP